MRIIVAIFMHMAWERLGLKIAICYRAVNENGEIGSLRQLETRGAVARISVPQLAKIDDQLLFVWTDKIDDQFQISSRRVPLDSIHDTDGVAGSP